jgi:hypothetical protein
MSEQMFTRIAISSMEWQSESTVGVSPLTSNTFTASGPLPWTLVPAPGSHPDRVGCIVSIARRYALCEPSNPSSASPLLACKKPQNLKELDNSGNIRLYLRPRLSLDRCLLSGHTVRNLNTFRSVLNWGSPSGLSLDCRQARHRSRPNRLSTDRKS